jgi:hypothetical protein
MELNDLIQDNSSTAEFRLEIRCGAWGIMPPAERRAIVKLVETAAQQAWLRMELLGNKRNKVSAHVSMSATGGHILKVRPEEDDVE